MIYIDSAYPATDSIIETEQRTNQMNNLLRIISDLQVSCSYDYLQTLPHVQKYLMSVRYIEELQKFVEDDNYTLSLRIEPGNSSPRLVSSKEDLGGSRESSFSDELSSTVESASGAASSYECSSLSSITIEGPLRRKTVMKEGKKPTLSSWKRYWIVLSGSTLIYFGSKALRANERRHYKSRPCKKISLTGWIVVLPDDPEHPNIFQLNDPDKGNVYKFQTGSRFSAIIWHKHLAEACSCPEAKRTHVIPVFSKMAFNKSMELYKLLGVQHVVIYNTSCGPDLEKLLQHYKREGILEIVPWPIDQFLNPSPGWNFTVHGGDLHYYGQLVTLNECIYRHMYQTEYIFLNDIDEIVMPYKYTNLQLLMEDLQSNNKDVGVFRIENHIFPKTKFEDNHRFRRPEWGNIPGINIMEHIYREPDRKNIYNPTKMIINPRMVMQTSVHSTLKHSGNVYLVPFDVCRLVT
ncbi:hypothetical protein P4O66_003024 [Electrophorus voltai]|uniref:Glycosyltransferase family 92 protein n=1 Tax=Electrophorus voltai TaxID=2609070 RepID=A0AAD8YTF5_9TELE|nr:hypothetical protein P4O66_003024 [Electrophorus voltai]